MNKNINCLVDLTALYDSRKRQHNRKKLDYVKLTNFLSLAAGASSIADFSDFRGYTIFSAKNQEQNDFVTNLRGLGWKIETYGQNEIELLENLEMTSSEYRFNSLMSLEVGSLLNDEVPSQIALVTNSFDMYNVMESAHEKDDQIEFLLVYFKDHMDPRWGNALDKSKNFIRFVDLNDIYRLPAVVKSETVEMTL